MAVNSIETSGKGICTRLTLIVIPSSARKFHVKPDNQSLKVTAESIAKNGKAVPCFRQNQKENVGG